MKESLTALLNLKKVVLLPFLFQLKIFSTSLMRNLCAVHNWVLVQNPTQSFLLYLVGH